MKITDIQIERYGVWNHLALPLPSAGLNVFYGPNEAGKTTLLKFIRDVLYGTQSLEKLTPDAESSTWNGALRISHAGRFCEAHRRTDSGDSRGLEFQELDPRLAWTAEPDWAAADSEEYDSTVKVGQPAEEALREILADTPARLFRQVFAIGLEELQALAALQEEEVARQIYGITLGVEGQKLLSVCSRLDRADKNSSWLAQNSAQIARLMNRDRELQRELESFAGQRERHQRLLEEQAGLESEVQDFKPRRAELEQQLHGHETVQRVWEPWNQVREYEAELRMLPLTQAASGVDPSRLSALENEIRELTRQRKTVLAEIGPLRKTLRQTTKETSPAGLVGEVQGFLSQRAWVVQIEREVELSSARARELKTEFEARQKLLGPEWPVQRLAGIDVSRAAYHRLVQAANGFQFAQARQASFRKRYDKHAAVGHQKQAELDQQIEAVGEPSLKEALEKTRQQLRQVEEISRLRAEEKELADRMARQKNSLKHLQDRSQVPEWVPGFLLFLAASGMFLSAVGFYTSLTSNGIAGAILALLGIAGFAIARGFKLDSQGRVEEGVSHEQTELHQQEKSLHDIQDSIKRMTAEAWIVSLSEADPKENPAETLIAAKLSNRLRELKRLARTQTRLKSRRRRLSQMRKAMQARQRNVGQARQAWCEALKQCGLPESVQVEDAFELWQKIAEVMEQMRAWDAARETAREVSGRHEAFCHRLAEFGQRTGHANLDYNHPVRVLDLWQNELAGRKEDNQEQLGLKRELARPQTRSQPAETKNYCRPLCEKSIAGSNGRCQPGRVRAKPERRSPPPRVGGIAATRESRTRRPLAGTILNWPSSRKT